MSEEGQSNEVGGEADCPKSEKGGLVAGTASEAAQLAIFSTLGIPPELQKNAYQVLSRLATSAAAWTASWMDDNRRERRAASDARVLLLKKTNERIAERLDVSEDYVEAAKEIFAERIVQRRKNVDAIARGSVEEMRQLPASDIAAANSSRTEVDEDWLNVFEMEAEQVTTEHGQKLFSRILAGEINKPSTFSKKTIKLLSQLDNRAADVFTRAASMTIATHKVFDARVVGLGSVGGNSLASFGLAYNDCTLLQDYGLVAADLEGFCEYNVSIFKQGQPAMPFFYEKQNWLFKPIDDRAIAGFRLEGMKLTASGMELLKVVDIVPNGPYTAALKAHFLERGFTMHRVHWQTPSSFSVETQAA